MDELVRVPPARRVDCHDSRQPSEPIGTGMRDNGKARRSSRHDTAVLEDAGATVAEAALRAFG
jgi:hypothetical protein